MQVPDNLIHTTKCLAFIKKICQYVETAAETSCSGRRYGLFEEFPRHLMLGLAVAQLIIFHSFVVCCVDGTG
jgi:hypothetical protein